MQKVQLHLQMKCHLNLRGKRSLQVMEINGGTYCKKKRKSLAWARFTPTLNSILEVNRDNIKDH